MKTTKTISRLVDLWVDNTEINNWSKFEWKRQTSKELEEMLKSHMDNFEHKFFAAIDEEKANSCRIKESGGVRTGDYRIGLEKAKELFEKYK
jgi:hypothetical protein